MENINTDSFEKAIKSLNSILERYKKDNYDIDIRDAVIQRFEYTYSLALKVISRFIKMQSTDVIDNMTFNQTIREANKLGLLKTDLPQWTEYRQKRNLTSHTYDEQVANDVISIIPEFKEEADYILSKIKELNK